MAMVISPRSKIVTLALLIGIITLVALIIMGVIGLWNGKSEKTNTTKTKMVSSKLQQITGYAAMQHVSKTKLRKATKTISDSLSLSRSVIYESVVNFTFFQLEFIYFFVRYQFE